MEVQMRIVMGLLHVGGDLLLSLPILLIAALGAAIAWRRSRLAGCEKPGHWRLRTCGPFALPFGWAVLLCIVLPGNAIPLRAMIIIAQGVISGYVLYRSPGWRAFFLWLGAVQMLVAAFGATADLQLEAGRLRSVLLH